MREACKSNAVVQTAEWQTAEENGRNLPSRGGYPRESGVKPAYAWVVESTQGKLARVREEGLLAHQVVGVVRAPQADDGSLV